MGARRLAVAVLDHRKQVGERRWRRPRRHSTTWALETRRQPSPYFVGAGKSPCARDRMVPAAASRRIALEWLRSASISAECVPASRCTRDSAPFQDNDRQPLPRTSPGFQNRLVAVRPASGTARTPGLADGRRNCPDVVEALSAAGLAGGGDRRRGQFRSGVRGGGLVSGNGRRRRIVCLRGRYHCLRRYSVLVDRGSVGRRLDAVAGHRMVGEPVATPRPELAVGRGDGKLAPYGAAHLALLLKLRDAG